VIVTDAESRSVILVVEDEESYQDALNIDSRSKASCRRRDEYRPARQLMISAKPDLVLLDSCCPTVQALTTAAKLYDSTRTPVIMVTARSSEVDVVLGLEIGAADYVTKPFRLRELIARIRAVLRRPLANTEDEIVTFGDLASTSFEEPLFVAAKRLNSAARSFDLLALFASRLGQVVTRECVSTRCGGARTLGHPHPRHARQATPPEDRERPRQSPSPHHHPWSGIPADP